MDTEDYVRELLGERAATRLQKKITGGRSNDEGFRFELFNCLVEVVNYAYAWAEREPLEPDTQCHHPSTVFLTQGAFAFVDDVVINTPEVTRFLQVKFSDEQKWTPEIKLDFDYQRDWQRDGEPYRLELIVHTYEREKYLTKSVSSYKPASLLVQARPFDETSDTLFQKVGLLTAGPQSARNKELALWHLELAWYRSSRSERISDTLERAREISRGMVRSFQPAPDFVNGVIAKLPTDEDRFFLAADGRTLIFEVGNEDEIFEGCVLIRDWCDFEERLRETPPSTVRELIAVAMEAVE